MTRAGGSKALCLLTTLFLAVLFGSARAAENAQARAELERIRNTIENVELWLQEAGTQRSLAESRLRDSELALQDGYRQQQSVQEEITRISDERLELDSRARALRANLTGQADLIQQDLRRLYMEGPPNPLKLFIGQENPLQWRRMQDYQQRLSRSRLQRIQRYQASMSELLQLESALDQQANRLAQQQSIQEATNARLQLLLAERELALSDLTSEISTRTTELARLVAERDQLESLLERIDDVLEDSPLPAPAVEFAAMKGRLAWPVPGRLSSNFNDPYGDGSLRRQGVVITADSGTPVRAVHQGRVVFADWLRGYGFLAIIDHGEGYMSLYGYNRSLELSPGSMVQAGDTLARLGNSGGQDAPAVYFEIRQNGRPQDPLDWFAPAAR